jgi:flavin reductase ActVB
MMITNMPGNDALPGSDGSPEAILREQFVRGMAKLPTGVVMVTTTIDGKPWGLTVSACCSVSADPPLLLVSLGKKTASAAAIGEAGCFGVSILSTRLLHVARLGAVPGKPKFVAEYCHRGSPDDSSVSSVSSVSAPQAIPRISGALAHFNCMVDREVRVADHAVIFGRVTEVITDRADSALVYWERVFRTAVPVEGVADILLDHEQEMSMCSSYPPW